MDFDFIRQINPQHRNAEESLVERRVGVDNRRSIRHFDLEGEFTVKMKNRKWEKGKERSTEKWTIAQSNDN